MRVDPKGWGARLGRRHLVGAAAAVAVVSMVWSQLRARRARAELPATTEGQPLGLQPAPTAQPDVQPLRAPEHDYRRGLHYFRPGQVSLLLRPADPARDLSQDRWNDPRSPLWVDLARAFENDLGARLAPDPLRRPPNRRTGRDRPRRELVELPGNTATGRRALLTVNVTLGNTEWPENPDRLLDPWMMSDDPQVTATIPKEIEAALKAVINAVGNANTRALNKDYVKIGEHYEVEAAAPNWYGMAYC